jgi:hypothetical protein
MAAAYMLEDAIKKTGSWRYAQLGIALQNVEAPSFFGKLHSNHLGVNEQRAMVTYQFDHAYRSMIVAPTDASNMPFVLPIPADTNSCPDGWQDEVHVVATTGCGATHKPQHSQEMIGRIGVSGGSGTINIADDAGGGSEVVNFTHDQLSRQFEAHFCEGKCRPCKVGTFAAVGGEACVPCEPGNVQAAGGASGCMECPLNYESNHRLTACVQCPAGTQRHLLQSVCTEIGLGGFDGAKQTTTKLVGGVLGGIIGMLLLLAGVLYKRHLNMINGPYPSRPSIQPSLATKLNVAIVHARLVIALSLVIFLLQDADIRPRFFTMVWCHAPQAQLRLKNS